jgi:rhamnogalacturonan endolyase
MWFWTAVLSAALVAGLTVKETDDGIVVDVEGDDAFVVTIDNSGSISSLQYRETEYQYSGTLSHIASGLGSGASVSHTTEGCSPSQFLCPDHIFNWTRELCCRFGHYR